MSDMSEVGVAAVRIVPVAKGFSADVARQIGAELGSAAKKAGADAGDEIAKGVTKAAKKAGADAGDALTAGLKGLDWPAPTGLPKAVEAAARRAGDDAADAIADSVRGMNWPPPTGLPKAVGDAARRAGDEVADELADSLKGLDWPAPTGLARELVPAARRAGDDAADAIADSVRGMNWPAPTGLARELVPAARRAGDDAGDEIADGIADGMDGGGGRVSSAVGRVGDLIKTGLAAAGIAAGALVVTGLSAALEQDALLDKFEASLGFPAEAAERMGGIAGDLYLEGFGESVADTGDVVRRVLQQGLLPEDATDDQIERLSTKILTFADVMAQDMDMTTQSIRSMIDSGIADSSEEALDILTTGLQQGADKAGDLLETFQEYSTSFRDIGISAEDATGLMIQGLDAGARDADKVADALKELAIRAQDGSATSAEGFRLLGLNADEMTAKFAAGGDAARDGLDQILDGLREIEDPATRNAAAVALFGTQAEDLGDALFNLDLDTAADRMGEHAGATDELASAYDNASSRIESFKRKALDKLITFIGNEAIPFIEELAAVIGPPLSDALDMVSDAIDSVDWTVFTDGWGAFLSGFEGEGPDLSGWQGTIQDFGDAVSTAYNDGLKPFGDWLSENKEVVIGALAGIGAVILAVVVPAMVGLAASTIAAAAPFILIGVAIAGLVAGILWLYENVESFRILVQTAWPIIQQIFTTALGIIQNMVTTTVGIISYVWDNWGTQLVNIATAAWDLVSGVIIGALNFISGTLDLILALMEGDWSGAWDAMKQIVDGAFQMIESIVTNGLEIIWNLGVIWWGLVRDFWSSIFGGIVADIRSKVDTIVGFFQSLPGRISRAIAGLANAMAAPFRAAFNGIKRAWNSTVGGFSVSIPGFLGFGGASFSIPSMHVGGIVGGPAGSDQLRVLQAGEGVFTRDQMAALGTATQPGPASAATVVEFDVTGADQEMARLIRRMVKILGGGDVQVAFGGRRRIA